MPYSTTPVPEGIRDLNTFISEEFEEVEKGMNELYLYKRHVEPDKPYDGQLVLADGTDWNPGSGAGFYGYNAAAWTFLG